jgi:hypothetical protein
LAGFRSSEIHVIDGQQWNGSTPFAVSWILDDRAAALLDDGSVGSAADATTRWEEFQAR